MSKLYKEIAIWKRVSDEEAIKYNCFEVLGQNKFCVQSADHYHLPISNSNDADLDKQFFELLIEIAPDERSDVHDSLEKAIIAFDKEFS